MPADYLLVIIFRHGERLVPHAEALPLQLIVDGHLADRLGEVELFLLCGRKQLGTALVSPASPDAALACV